MQVFTVYSNQIKIQYFYVSSKFLFGIEGTIDEGKVLCQNFAGQVR